jgi:hypothetical protein
MLGTFFGETAIALIAACIEIPRGSFYILLLWCPSPAYRLTKTSVLLGQLGYQPPPLPPPLPPPPPAPELEPGGVDALDMTELIELETSDEKSFMCWMSK